MGKAAGCWKFRRDKQVAWRYSKPKGDQSMMAVEMLSPEGKPSAGECSALNEFHSNEPLDQI